MSKVGEIFGVLSEFLKAVPTIAMFKPPKDEALESIGLLLQQTAEKHPNNIALIFEDREVTWKEFNELVNRYAGLLKSLEVTRGDAVSIFMENRVAMLASLFAVTKIGAVAALVNTGLKGKPLIHCLTTTESKKCLFGQELTSAVAEVKDQLPFNTQDFLWVPDEGYGQGSESPPQWATNTSPMLAHMPTDNPEETPSIRAGEKAIYIFTSGTTGLPKAAIIYHRRFLAGATVFGKLGLQSKPGDRIYLCLPLYHMTGLVTGFGSALFTGATVFIRRRFSANKFWPEVQKYQTNMFIYIGELCRFLAMQPNRPEEINNPITAMMGNGLRPDVWDTFRERFAIDRIFEFYGSSEGNATFLNVLNKDKTIGTSSASLMLAKYDVVADELVRDAEGRLIEVEKGEPGLLLAEVSEKYNYDGYINSEATNSKILRSVKKPDDRWFNTGDMIKQIDVGLAFGLPHYQFVDRVGDTFRWRGENVSTNEVSEILSQFSQVETANVYGVEIPGAEGRAGMVSLTLNTNQDFDIQGFSELANSELPAYARPVFLRLQQSAETTGTFKLQKGKLRDEGFDIEKITDPLYAIVPGSTSYQRLNQPLYQKIRDGAVGF